MTAVRIARGATRRELIVKFDGGYHGHADHFLVKAGSGLATGGLPASGGVPEGVTESTISLPYNDTNAVEQCFDQFGAEIAGVLVEPIAANMGVIPPQPGFLQTLRDLSSKHGSVLIFDEVITGFRVAPGGATALYGTKPDLVCLGKILGGGLPIGGVGGRADLMDNLAPLGSVYQAGTLSGNPISVAAGIATLRELANPVIYQEVKAYAAELTSRLENIFTDADLPLQVNRVESLFTLFLSEKPVINFDGARSADMERYNRLFHVLLENGIFLPPSGFEAWFVSQAHNAEHLELTVKAVQAFIESEKRK
jgi:glutamate-1-semialdehyde 2,1-aminomutase